MLDLVILRLLKDRKEFNKYSGIIPTDGRTIDPQTTAIIVDFKRYFKDFPSHTKIDPETFMPRFKAWHPAIDTEKLAQYNAILRNVFNQDVDEDQRRNIIGWLAEVEMSSSLLSYVEAAQNGDIEEPFSRVSTILDTYKKRTEMKFDSWVDDSIDDMLIADVHESGIKWRLNCLNDCMRPMRPGDFGIIAGRPDKGKTTFLTSEATFMAPQLEPEQSIIWLNNEGPGQRIARRLYQSALGLSIKEMIEYPKGELEKMYVQIMGRRDKIRVVDIHGWTNSQVEMILESCTPGVIIYDMIDKVRGFGNAARTDLALEQMYDWGRERSVKYGAIGLATSQISNEGDGLMYPSLGMLKDSKTGKQGACDFQLMIGAVNDHKMSLSRFLGLPKNKLQREGFPSDPRCEVQIDVSHARYRDLEFKSFTENNDDVDVNALNSALGG